MSKHEKISLPTRREDGSTIHQTLEGEWLVGFGLTRGTPGVAPRATEDEVRRWGRGSWFVIRSASNKLVVYKRVVDVQPTIAIYDSFEAMQPHVPPSIYETAMEKAGLREPQQFAEVPLEGV